MLPRQFNHQRIHRQIKSDLARLYSLIDLQQSVIDGFREYQESHCLTAYSLSAALYFLPRTQAVFGIVLTPSGFPQTGV